MAFKRSQYLGNVWVFPGQVTARKGRGNQDPCQHSCLPLKSAENCRPCNSALSDTRRQPAQSFIYHFLPLWRVSYLELSTTTRWAWGLLGQTWSESGWLTTTETSSQLSSPAWWEMLRHVSVYRCLYGTYAITEWALIHVPVSEIYPGGMQLETFSKKRLKLALCELQAKLKTHGFGQTPH